jgi:hypothetical protein
MKHSFQSLSAALFVGAALLCLIPFLAKSSDLELRIAAQPDPVWHGGRLVMRLEVANRGAVDLSGVVARMVAPANTTFYYTDASPYADAARRYYPGDVARWTLGTVPAGGSRTVTVSAYVGNGESDVGRAPEGSLLVLQGSAVAANGQEGTASATVVVGSQQYLWSGLEVLSEPAMPGEELTYRVLYGNRGGTERAGVGLRLVLPPEVTLLRASDEGVAEAGGVRWELGTLGPQQLGERLVTVQVGESLGSGTVLVGTSEVSDTLGVGRGTAVTTVKAAPALQVSLAAQPDPVWHGGRLVMRLEVANRGAVDLSGVVARMVAPANTTFYYTDASPYADAARRYYPGDVARWTLGTVPARRKPDGDGVGVCGEWGVRCRPGAGGKFVGVAG